MPQISLWPTPLSHLPLATMNSTIDITQFSPSPTDRAFDYELVLARLQSLTLRSQSDPALTTSSPDSASFFISHPRHTEFDSKDSFVELSPMSSMSSDSASSRASLLQASKETAFFSTRSRVVRLYNLPTMADSLLSALFHPHNSGRFPIPATMWELRDGGGDGIWAVFRTHEEAAAALALSGRAMSVATALEADLEPFHKLHRVVLRNSVASSPLPSNSLHLPPPPALRASPSLSDLQTSYASMAEISTVSAAGQYTLSSNPPNPKTSFRLGDWICSSPNCAAHNFGRNLACIGCGCPRSNNGNGSGSTLQHQHQHQHQQSPNPNARALPSPRFNTMNNNVTYYSSGPSPAQGLQAQQQPHLHHPQPHQRHQQPQQHLNVQQHLSVGYSPPQPPSPFGGSSASSVPHTTTNAPKSSHPLLTPSGRAFAIGGKVQNISSDPLSPCIMYWPDNEPFPEQGQIRPSGLVGVAPPILNTGNRGPISHQPGDWICQKCNYLNWRRRKVCQTCLPYAEGNGDSISAAVQAERIALLTSVLSQNQTSGGSVNTSSANQMPRSHSLTPPQARRPFIDLSPQQTPARPVHRSQSHYALGQQFSQSAPQHYTASSPIYQTSGNRQPSPLYSTGPDVHRNININAHTNMNHLSVNANHIINANAHVHSQIQSNVNVSANTTTTMNTSHGSSHVNNNFNLPSVSVHAPAPLLPSFLQDIVQSPALSPTSTTTSSADLSSVEEYEDLSSPRSMFPRARGDSGSSDVNSPIANIWRLDGEESKSLSAFPLPNHQELVGGRKHSTEKLRA
ncbi:hypothetical protein GALMADRAFT_224788 [Galerina marginata CBS 339.88]|uniref:RanBP2-type domain-containing protein n=1 Tax=Galerina marginata (strain CBS 339.88) TaxID=685588 RepID=A0A067TET9_GALM3|nr:hypothetical protein GALMADRAFT_224788 [Galerina marginata CBS 339.88]